MTQNLVSLLESNRFNQFITALIIINAITLGLETSPEIMQSYGVFLLTLDKIILSIFVVEILLKFIAYRFSFFKSGWNWFDLIIVVVSLMPTSGALTVLRAFRILRVLRLFSIVPQMRRVINGLFKALPGMGSIIGVLFIVFYISAVLCTKLFGATDDPTLNALFGDLNTSMFTLFQLMTLENWVDGIVKPVTATFPYALLFFIPFIIITSFAVLNLFIGVIVESMQSAHKEEEKADEINLHNEIKDVQNKLDTLTKLLRDQSPKS
jgi:voltage-gated sodium channel